MRIVWHGLDLDTWSRVQTLNRRPLTTEDRYSGVMRMGVDWWDFIEEIPLELRFASFSRRLAEAQAK